MVSAQIKRIRLETRLAGAVHKSDQAHTKTSLVTTHNTKLRLDEIENKMWIKMKKYKNSIKHNVLRKKTTLRKVN